LRDFVKGGEEHRFQRGASVYRKATYPGHCGFTVILVNGQPTLIHALPAEYLARLALSNRLFGDDIRLLGIVSEPAGLSILTSGNLLRDAGGIVMPIDVIVVEADDELAACLESLV
jgi:hypothetical protein